MKNSCKKVVISNISDLAQIVGSDLSSLQYFQEKNGEVSFFRFSDAKRDTIASFLQSHNLDPNDYDFSNFQLPNGTRQHANTPKSDVTGINVSKENQITNVKYCDLSSTLLDYLFSECSYDKTSEIKDKFKAFLIDNQLVRQISSYQNKFGKKEHGLSFHIGQKHYIWQPKKQTSKKLYFEKLWFSTVYNYMFGHEFLKSDTKLVVLLEGEKDTIAANFLFFVYDLPFAAVTVGGVGSWATAKEQLRYIRETSPNAVLVSLFDHDKAGIETAQNLENQGILPILWRNVLAGQPLKKGFDFCDAMQHEKGSIAILQVLFDVLRKPTPNDHKTPQIAQKRDNLPLIVCSRYDATMQVKTVLGQNKQVFLVCEFEYVDTAKRDFAGQNIETITYKQLSTLRTQIDKDSYVFVFGSQYFTKQFGKNSAKEVIELSKLCNVVLFSDVEIPLPFRICTSYFVSNTHQYTTNYEVLLCENQDSTFLHLINNNENAYYLETSLSITNITTNCNLISHKHLNYFECHERQKKTIFVNYKKDCNVLPFHLQGFERVIFVCENSAKPFLSLETWQNTMLGRFEASLAIWDNDRQFEVERQFSSYLSKLDFEAVWDGTKFQVCEASKVVQSVDYQCKMYANNPYLLAADCGVMYANNPYLLAADCGVIASFFVENVESEQVSIETEKKELKVSKRNDFNLFFDILAVASITDLACFEAWVCANFDAKTMPRGVKLAIQRIRELSKYVSFPLAVELVASNYYNFEREKSRCMASHIAKNSTSKQANRLKSFADTFSSDFFTQSEIIAGWTLANQCTIASDKEAWKQINKSFYIERQRKMIKGNYQMYYSLALIE